MRSGRRRFLQNSALFSAGFVATSLLHSRRTRASDENVEALVIGSGYGGSVTALRLGQAGINTLILERGRRWPITNAQNTFATARNPDGRAAWLSTETYDGVPVNIYTGVLDKSIEDGINVLRGACLGGGSIVNNVAMVVPRSREVFYQVFPSSLDYDQLIDVYFNRVRSIIEPSPIPQDILSTDYYDLTRLFVEQATKAEFPNYLLDLAVDWNIVREEIAGVKSPSTIVGEIYYGCNSGAKRSLDHNYIPLAEKTGFVDILTLHVATEITEVPGHGYRVSCNQINESGEVVATKSITCRYLFLAAGSLGTSQLLVKAKAKGTLPRLNNYIGKFWSTNGDANVNPPLPSANGKGGFAGAILEHFDNPKGPVILMNTPGWNYPEGKQPHLGIGLPKQYGTFRYDASTDAVKLSWSKNTQENKSVIPSIKNTVKILDQKNSTSTAEVTSELIEDNIAHPLGGAVMEKACDQYGRVFGYQGLYVVDGALIPGSAGCANPALTQYLCQNKSLDKF
jgi:cholesterol oxidase